MTKRAGVMGWPVSHSMSPRLHGYWLQHYHVDGAYDLLPTEPQNIKAELDRLAALGYVGVNLTVPHKEVVLPFLAEIDPLAARAGAVNTVLLNPDGHYIGRNTDVYGVRRNLETGGYQPDGRAVVLLGAGGAARSGIVALMDMGVTEIHLCNRTRDKAEKLATEFGAAIKVFDWGDSSVFRGGGLVVNSTSLGMRGQPPLEVSLDLLPADAVVSDMVYAPLITGLLEQAKAHGHRIIDGLGMLLHQAKPAFHAFFGAEPDVTPALRNHVLAGMKS